MEEKGYDGIYRKNPDIFGKGPSKWIRKILKYVSPPAKILDLGVGQGRNALFLAEKGYTVVGVDVNLAVYIDGIFLTSANIFEYELPSNGSNGDGSIFKLISTTCLIP